MDPEKDYVSVVYDPKIRPVTSYPQQLVDYLIKRYHLKPGMKILDLGCGRGDFLNGFVKQGLDGYGVDQSQVVNTFYPSLKIANINFLMDPVPFPDNHFDIVFSKSVLEHFYYPEEVVKEIYRVLKPGGIAINMVPDWEAIYQTYYDDYTHRTPFTMASLKDILTIHGFQDVLVEKFLQLPFVWKQPWLKMYCWFIRTFVPRQLRPYSKTIRFSQEIMLLSSAGKAVAR